MSVKTRTGFNPPSPKGFGRAGKEDYLFDKEWIKNLLEENISALTIHLRTKKELSLVPAHWELMPEIIKLRNKISPDTLIIGNGDVRDLQDAKEKALKYGCDGIMIGRGVFGNPWFFAQKEKVLEKSLGRSGDDGQRKFSAENFCAFQEKLFSDVQDKLQVLVEHAQIFERELLIPKHKNFAVMKKHFKAYVNDFPGAKELRIKLMETENSKQVQKIIKDFLYHKKI